MSVQLTSSEQELLGQLAGFAARRAVNGVYMNQMYSKSLNAPVLLLVALGEQAVALEKLVMGAQEQQQAVEIFTTDDIEHALYGKQ